MTKINVTVEYLRTLHEHAEKIGNLPKWAALALDWAEKANDRITELQDKVQELEALLNNQEAK